jgi:hypothetical protein
MSDQKSRTQKINDQSARGAVAPRRDYTNLGVQGPSLTISQS